MDKISSKQFEENREKEKHGKNVEINFVFARHSEKATGDICDTFDVSLSSGGKELAREFGKKIERPRGAYVTSIERTPDTADLIFETSDPAGKNKWEFYNPPPYFPEHEEREFEKIYLEKRKKLMDKSYPGQDFDKLSPSEQEEIAWQATEPALEWVLSLDQGGPNNPDKSSVPYQWAAPVAYNLNRLVELADKLKSGRKLNIPPVIGHKTQTEPFLVYALKELQAKTLPERLREIGGGLHVMEGWRFSVTTDDLGGKEVKLIFREKEYELDIEVLQELAKDGKNIIEDELCKKDRLKIGRMP